MNNENITQQVLPQEEDTTYIPNWIWYVLMIIIWHYAMQYALHFILQIDLLVPYQPPDPYHSIYIHLICRQRKLFLSYQPVLCSWDRDYCFFHHWLDSKVHRLSSILMNTLWIWWLKEYHFRLYLYRIQTICVRLFWYMVFLCQYSWLRNCPDNCRYPVIQSRSGHFCIQDALICSQNRHQ